MPQGWTVVSTKDCGIRILNGYAFQSSKYTNEGIRIIRITNVQDGYIQDNEPKYYSSEYQAELEKYSLHAGDLLISLTGNVGRVGFLKENFLPAALNQRVGCIRLNSSVIDKEYLFYFLQSSKFRSDCVDSGKGVAQLNISTEWLKSYTIPLPPIDEQHRIVETIKKSFYQLNTMAENL